MANIMLVDDDELLNELVQMTLEERGHEVSVASNGEDALAMAAAQRFDLVVLDGMMPGMDGLEVLKSLQDAPETRSTPVVILSARRQQSDIVGGLSQGAEDYLVKPFMPEELVARVDKILGRPAG